MPCIFFRPFFNRHSKILLRPGLAIRGACLGLFFAFFSVSSGLAAVPEVFQNSSGSGRQNEGQENISGKHDAAVKISGSQWPGIIDHVLQKPLPDSAGDSGHANILVNYPSLGNNEIDNDIRQWVSGIASAFESHLDLDDLADADFGGDLLPDDDLASAGEKHRFELYGSYSISRPSPNAVSITFELWNYTGSNHGNLDIITLNYSLLTGKRLEFVDMFEEPDVALQMMSEYARNSLESRLGAARRTQMLKDGTEALMENFSSLTLTPGGICINFQPYQVAPWAAGIQKVEMPVEKLLPAGPFLAIWGK